jgi:DNA polymerase-1
MYLTPTDKHWICDVEANGFHPTKIWVLCACNAITKEKKTLTAYEDIKAFVEEVLRTGGVFVGHNFLHYDVPSLNRLVGTRIGIKSVVDTLVLSTLYSPKLAGGHALADWAIRLGGKAKVDHEDWHNFSPELVKRCEVDVEINTDLYLKLSTRMRKIGFTERGCEIEHKAAFIIRKQKLNGFHFNYPEANALYAKLRQEEKDLQDQIYKRFPPELKCVETYKRGRRADGSRTANYERHLEEYEKLEDTDDGGYRAYAYVDFNLGSPPQRVEKLLALGWQPREFTKPSKTHPEGQPKATEEGDLVPSLKEFAEESGIEEVKLIAQWIAINARANMIGNWINLYNHETGCIHGNLWLASTLRYRHDKPNTANIPAVRCVDYIDSSGQKHEVPLTGKEGYYTYEARDLWDTRDRTNRRLVGVDAKGIQLRVLAHYLNDPVFTEAILSADPHAANQKAWNFEEGKAGRSLAKTIVYATLMGAGDARISVEAGISLKKARAAKKLFFERVPGLKELITRLKQELDRTGRITLCDGSKVLVSSPHMVIPYLLQGDESRLMKQAAIYVDEMVRKEKLDVLKVGDIHDEWQNDVLAAHVDRYIEVCKECFKRAGEAFAYRLPIECDAAVGLTWAETH